MNEPADLDSLARRYLDLWERQAARIATDSIDGIHFRALMKAMTTTTMSDSASERADEGRRDA